MRLFTFTRAMGITHILLLTLLLASCSSERSATPTPQSKEAIIEIADLNIVTGQTVYVPAYSEIFYVDTERTWDFAVTLAVHNTALDAPIVITSVRYFDGHGALVREYNQTPVQLDALASRAYTVARDDRTGGVGANFIVEWVAASQVTPPVIEAVMISAAGQQGLSLISPGRVIGEISASGE